MSEGPDTQRKRITLSDVAAQAGVSTVTASRALRRPEMVSPALRARVETAVRDLAYIPNQLASALASSRTHTIGVVIPSLTNGVFADYIRALHDVFIPAGFQVLVSNSRYSPAEEEAAIAAILGQHPEAMIVAGIDQTAHARRLLEQSGVPVVQTMEIAEDPIDINIGLSQRGAGRAATRFLLDLGHTRVGHTSARLDPRARRRMDGYIDAMEEAGLDHRALTASTPRPSTVGLGAELFAAILARSPDIEALFCCNDDLALGALFECQRRGIRVPTTSRSSASTTSNSAPAPFPHCPRWRRRAPKPAAAPPTSCSKSSAARASARRSVASTSASRSFPATAPGRHGGSPPPYRSSPRKRGPSDRRMLPILQLRLTRRRGTLSPQPGRAARILRAHRPE